MGLILSELIKTCQNLSKSVQTCQNLTEYVKTSFEFTSFLAVDGVMTARVRVLDPVN